MAAALPHWQHHQHHHYYYYYYCCCWPCLFEGVCVSWVWPVLPWFAAAVVGREVLLLLQ